MENGLTVFSNEEFGEVRNELSVINEQEVLGKPFRVYGTVDQPLFLAKDVAYFVNHFLELRKAALA